MFVAFGALALAIAEVGLYSVMAYGVVQRRQEIGVRLALRAPRANVVRLIVSGGHRLVIVGAVVGSAIALWAGKSMESLLFQESPADPLVYGAVVAVLIVVGLLATALPAYAAARVDPNLTLRADWTAGNHVPTPMPRPGILRPDRGSLSPDGGMRARDP